MTTRVTGAMPLSLDSAIIRAPLVVSPETLVTDAIAKMAQLQTQENLSHPVGANSLHRQVLEERSDCVVVVAAEQVCGLITARDVVRLSAQKSSLNEITMQAIITPPVVTLSEADLTDVGETLELLQRHCVRHLPLLDEHERLVGMVTQTTLQSLCILQQLVDHELSQQREDLQQHSQAEIVENQDVDPTAVVRPIEAILNREEFVKQAILSAIPDYLFCVDGQGVYREVITYKKEITLFPENLDPVGLSMTEVLPKAVAKRQLSYLEDVIRTGHLQTYEHQVQLGNQTRDEEVRVIRSGADEFLFIVRDISDRKQAERQLQGLIEATAATTEKDFFPALVRHIAAALDVNYAIVTELVDNELRALAFWANGAPHAPISYHPAKTPCELTLRQGRFYCATLLQQHFPEDLDLAEMQAESYLGIALYDVQGNVIGDLCILDHQPIQSPQRAEAILQIFAARATAELERQRARLSLEQLNQSLEAKVAERTAELQERERFLQTVLDTFPLAIFWKDHNSVYLGCNHNCAKNAGFASVADIIGKTDYDMPWGETQAEAYRADDRQVMSSNTAKLGIIEPLLNAEGKCIWLETNKLPLHNLAGEVFGVLGTYQDITPRKQLELALQNSQQQLSEVLDTAIAGITRLRLYPDGELLYDYISPHCEKNFGYTAAELFPDVKLWQSRIDSDDWALEALPVLQAILAHRGNSTHRMEYRFNRKDGSVCWILANCFVQWNETREYWYLTIVDTDISDRKQAESQLQNLIAGTAATTGQDFFPALVKHIAEALDVSHVFVAECCDDRLQSLAVWANGELQSNESFPLVDTPCERSIQDGIFYCERSIRQQFPNYQALLEMRAESYLGIALRDIKENITGVLCIFHHRPLQDVQRAMQILQVFAARAAAELERQRTNNALEQLNQALEAKVAERTAELREREQFLHTVLDTFPLTIFWKDRNSVYLGGNRNFLANAGLRSLKELLGKTDHDLPWTKAEAAAYRANDHQIMDSNTAQVRVLETQQTAEGNQIWIETTKLPLHNLEGEVIGVLGTCQDITDRKAAEIVIKQQLAAIEAAIDGIGILQNDAYIYVNQAHLNLFGYTHLDELLGNSWRALYSPTEIQRFEQEILPMLEREHAWQGEAIATRKDGSMFVQGVSLSLMEDGRIISVCRDISELKQAQEQSIHNALHDPLTGLPNRRLLLDRIELALQRARRLNVYQYAVLFLDLDRFKIINDSLGHLVGDKLLIEVSKRLKQHLRNTDMVARLGGDEFVILLEDVSAVEDVIQVAKRILADCQTPVLIDDHKIFVSTSIGIAIGSETYYEASNLIRDADIAMYRAKAQENNSYKFFDGEMYLEAMQRLTLETDLRKAITQQEFVIYYQPIIRLIDNQLIGFEALARWQHPTRGLICPSEFIPVAEETGLIMSLDSWVIHQVCEQVADWRNRFPNHFPIKISVNLSVQDLHRASLLQDIDQILNSTCLSGEMIALEITESTLIKDIDKTIDLLAQLASRQIQISIDDFGTGYSSLSYLHRLPIHSLKIDRSFVGNMHLENPNYQVVSTILALSQQLGLTVVAEGIETFQHLQQLQTLGCELGQGYLFSKPLNSCEVESLLDTSIITVENLKTLTKQT